MSRVANNVQLVVKDPASNTDLATKGYVDSQLRYHSHPSVSTGSSKFNGNRVEDVGYPKDPTDACTMQYVLDTANTLRELIGDVSNNNAKTTATVTPSEDTMRREEITALVEHEFDNVRSETASKLEVYEVRTGLERLRARVDERIKSTPVNATTLDVKGRRVTGVATPVNANDVVTLGRLQDEAMCTKIYIDGLDTEHKVRVTHLQQQVDEVRDAATAAPADARGALDLDFIETHTYGKQYIDAMEMRTGEERVQLQHELNMHTAAVDVTENGVMNVKKRRIVDVCEPIELNDVVTRAYLERYSASRHDVASASADISALQEATPTYTASDNTLSMKNRRVTCVAEPADMQDAVTRSYLESYAAKQSLVDAHTAKVQEEVGVLQQRLSQIEANSSAASSLQDGVSIDHKSRRVINVANPVSPQDAATAHYVSQVVDPIAMEVATLPQIVEDVGSVRADLAVHAANLTKVVSDVGVVQVDHGELKKEVGLVQSGLTKLTNVVAKSVSQVSAFSAGLQKSKTTTPSYSRSILHIRSIPSPEDTPHYRLHHDRPWYGVPCGGSLQLLHHALPTGFVKYTLNEKVMSFKTPTRVEVGDKIKFELIPENTPLESKATTSDYPLCVDFLYYVDFD